MLPQDCILCNQETPHILICSTCLDYLPHVKPPFCCICGRPTDATRLCLYCQSNSWLDYGRAWLCFVPPVNILIHHFKYRQKTHVATLLGRAMASMILTDPVLQHADIIAPVPLFWLKRLYRGYNQSFLLARVISKNTGLYQANLLKRIRYTRTQTRLSEQARHKNIANAFSLAMPCVENKCVLLIDDVMTTGATINECAKILKDAGAKEVYSCVAAITP